MKIAFVRGPFLNPWELQTYLPLLARHEFQAIGADWMMYEAAFKNMVVPLAKPHVWAGGSAFIHPNLPIFLNRFRSWTWGESYALTLLDRVVGDAQILHPAETHSTMTHQCLEIRKRRPCKVIATVWENIPHMGETHPIRKHRKALALKTLDGFLAVTETSRRMLLDEGAPAERIEVIPMAVDLDHFKPAVRDADWSKRWALKPEEKVVLFIGRWVKEKGIQDILDAIPQVKRECASPIRFCFVGNGPMEKELHKAAAEFPGNISLIPFISYDRLPVLHNMADVFILPSKSIPKWREQFGYVLAESMACAKAIITTRSGSIPDVVGDAAVLIPESDAAALASALVCLLNAPGERQRLGAAARTWALEQFDAQKNSRRIEAFYERVLKQPA